MSLSTAAQKAAVAPVAERPDLKQLRDDLVRSYAPGNAHEFMLVTQIAQSFLRLQRAQDAEARYFDGKDILEAVASDLAKYKIITRYVAECERAWRHAVENLEKSQRRRMKNARPASAPRVSAIPSSRPTPILAPQPDVETLKTQQRPPGA